MSQPNIIADIDDFLQDGKSNGDRIVVPENKVIPVKRIIGPVSGLQRIEGDAVYVTESGEEFSVPDFYHDPRTPDAIQSEDQLRNSSLNQNDTLDKFVYNFDTEPWEVQVKICVRHKTPAVIVIGESGVGKSAVIESLADKFGYKVVTFNAPNMDPFLHLIGIPHIVKEDENEEIRKVPGQQEKGTSKECLKFIKTKNLDDADIIFLDELSRVPGSVQNKLFELVHSRRVNGVPFAKLKSVWAAMNPHRDDVQTTVHQLDSAFGGRFVATIIFKAKPKIKHWVNERSIGEKVGRDCLRWWHHCIKGKEQMGLNGQAVKLDDIITPRVLAYIAGEAQRMNNDLFHPGQGEEPIDVEEWNLGIDMLMQHHHIPKNATNITIPVDELKKALLEGEEIVALSSLRNGAPGLDKLKAEVKADPLKAMKMAELIADAVRQVAGKPPEIPTEDLGNYSEILCSMNPDAAGKILVNRTSLAGYLKIKANFSEEQRKAEAARRGNKNDPIVLPTTQGEVDLYNYLKSHIDATIAELKRRGAEKQKEVGRAAPSTTAPAKVAGGIGPITLPGAQGAKGAKPAGNP